MKADKRSEKKFIIGRKGCFPVSDKSHLEEKLYAPFAHHLKGENINFSQLFTACLTVFDKEYN